MKTTPINLLENNQPINGFLFVGDPHLSPNTIGRRLDSTMETMLNKINQSILLANQKNLQVVFLGDLFHSPKENSNILKTLLLRELKKAKYVPITLVGNHDIHQATLTADTAMAVLAECGLLLCMDQNGLYHEFIVKETNLPSTRKVSLGATPYGMKIPNKVSPHSTGNICIWVSHHNVAFEGHYPGEIVTPFEIEGCQLLVNGHMHLTKPAIEKGQTTWFNPGNINRVSIDQINHIPCVWEWNTDLKEPTPHKLTFKAHIFDTTGHNVKLKKETEEKEPPSEKISSKVEVATILQSAFATTLAAQTEMEKSKTYDGNEAAQLLLDKAAQSRYSKNTQLLAKSIIDRAQNKNNS